jgi:hypothetical protein
MAEGDAERIFTGIAGSYDRVTGSADWSTRRGHDTGLKHRPKVVADRPMLDDPAVADPEAMGVGEIDPAARGWDRAGRPGEGARGPNPGHDLIVLGDERLDVDVEVWLPAPDPLVGLADLDRPERLALRRPLGQLERRWAKSASRGAPPRRLHRDLR